MKTFARGSVDTYFFSDEKFIDELLNPSHLEIYFRATVMIFLFVFATFAHFSTKKLQQSEAKFAGILELAHDAIISIDEEQRIILFNNSAEEMFGYSQNEILGEHIEILIPELFRGEHYKLSANYSANRQEIKRLINMIGVRKNREEFPAETSLSVYQSGHKKIVTVTLHDITARHKKDEKLRKLSQAIQQGGEALFITDKDAIIEYVNPAFTKITGYEAGEVIGKTPSILKSNAQDPSFYKALWKTITRGEVWHGILIDKKKDGSFYSAMMTVSPIQNERGETTHYVSIQQDMTDYITMEQQFQQAQKMEAVGTLVGGIAHDFNNMLAGITGNIYLARLNAQGMPDVVQNLDNIEKISFRAADMIKQLLTFARKGKVSMKPFDLTPFIKETVKFLRISVPENIQMHQNLCSDPLQIYGDVTQLHQVLMNLLNNARDAVEGVDKPCISISLEMFHADDEFIKSYSYFTGGFYAHLSVKDNGCGIPGHKVKHLFEPFYTTKEQGKGTGLGLAMVFGAMKTHHGYVGVESIEGEGSTFSIYLPLLEIDDIAIAPSQVKKVVKGQGETILLVDDDPHIVGAGKKVLESLGYRVLTATDGQQAVNIFEARPEDIDLCIVDIVMPVLGGDKAIRLIRQINPHVKVIFATGYDKKNRIDMANETVLSKPFSVIEMSHLIRKKLSC